MTFSQSGLFLFAIAFSLQPIFAKEKDFEFNFWTSPITKSDKRVLRVDPHPCGEVAVARIHKLPKYSKQGGLIPDRVFELNESGKILRQWSVPVDSTVRAVRGDSLYIDFYKKNYLIESNGQVALVKSPPARITPHIVQCVTPFEPSTDAACMQHKDTVSGKIRILSYETICS